MRVAGDRRQRLLKILELIATHTIRTQEELAESLGREGFEVTQSSVSRDIAALHLVKADGAYVRPTLTRAPRPDPDEQRLVDGILAVEPAGDALLVVHTPPGEANRVGAALDRLAWADVVGTLAGDNTIFIAVRDRRAQRRLGAAFRKLGIG